MAVKVKLGNRPKTFKHTVSFQMLEGEEGLIPLRYKYRTQTEFGEFIDKITAAAEEAVKKEIAAAKAEAAKAESESVSDAAAQECDEEVKAKVKKFSMKELMEKTAESNADYIMEVVDSWELDVDFSRENVQQLCDELPAGAIKIMEDYRLACREGRLGN